MPEAQAAAFIGQALDALTAARQPSFFTSMKLMGQGNKAPLSFPKAGLAFSIDVPVHEQSLQLLADFDIRLAEAGGRVYLAKDARCRPDALDAFYPQRRAWAELAARHDPDGHFSSDMAKRLQLRQVY